MESLCSPSQGSTHPHCGDPTGEGEAARASSTDGNYSGLIWVLIGNIGVWISSGSGWAPSGTICSIPVGMEAWLPTLDPEFPVPPWWPGTVCGSCPSWLGIAPSSQQLQPGTQSWGCAPGSSLEQPLAAEVP